MVCLKVTHSELHVMVEILSVDRTTNCEPEQHIDAGVLHSMRHSYCRLASLSSEFFWVTKLYYIHSPSVSCPPACSANINHPL